MVKPMKSFLLKVNKPMMIRMESSRRISKLSPEYIEILNERDKNSERQTYIQELSQWKPVKSYLSELNSIDSTKLFDISYIHKMYQLPLEDYQKVYIRSRIYGFYQISTCEKEKKMLYSILSYYKVLE
jgi:hypothetical protein